jgi:hypothetical protein
MLSVFCKLPIQPMTKMEHLKQMLIVRIILSVFQFRINDRCGPTCTKRGRTRSGRPRAPARDTQRQTLSLPAPCAACIRAHFCFRQASWHSHSQ